MTVRHATQEVQLVLMGALLGVAVPLAIDSVVTAPAVSEVVACVAVVVNALNFFHGKSVSVTDPDYALITQLDHKFALQDYVLNLLLVITFVIMALTLGSALALALGNVALRFIDFVLVRLVVQKVGAGVVGIAQRFWLWMDAAGVGIFGVLAIGVVSGFVSHGVVAWFYFAYIAFDIVWDYTRNGVLYFARPTDWDHVAARWDAMQGAEGDEYRQRIIYPALSDALGDINGQHALDVGAGNGCVSRWLAARGATVTAVDSSERLMELATYYPVPRPGAVEYIVRDVDEDGGLRRLQTADVAVAIFVLQDCSDLWRAMENIAAVVRAGGRLLSVVEVPGAGVGHFTTERLWLDDPNDESLVEHRQLIIWAGGADDPSDSPLATTTHHRSVFRFRQVAEMTGWSFVRERTLDVDRIEPTDSLSLRAYAAAPKFRMLEFSRAE